MIFVGLLNRVMLTELGFPGLLVGGALAFEQLVAPSASCLARYRMRILWRAGTARLTSGSVQRCSAAWRCC